jgi:hypothetical protein
MMMKSNWQSKVVNVGFLARNNDAALVMRCCCDGAIWRVINFSCQDQWPMNR